MKKIFFATLAVAALALSCQKNEVVVENPSLNQAIEFSTYSAKAPQTKGIIMNNAALNKFGITAFYTDEANWGGTSESVNFMWNQKVEWLSSGEEGAGSWTYTPVKYWPTETTDKISFFAYAPYSEGNKTNGIVNSNNDEIGTPTLVFTVNNAADKMVDFVADQVIDRQHASTTEEGNAAKVQFALQHELTRLTIDAKVSTDLINTKGTTIINVKTVELDGLTNGKFYQSAKYTFGNTSDARGTWDYTDATYLPETYSLSSVLDLVTPATDTYGGYVVSGVQLGYAETTTAKSLFEDNEYLFLIPVTANDGNGLGEEDASVTFTYDIVTVDPALENGHSVTPATKTVYLPTGIMKQGVAYKITFLFEIDQIEVSATVDPWGTEETADTNIPYLPDDETK